MHAHAGSPIVTPSQQAMLVAPEVPEGWETVSTEYLDIHGHSSDGAVIARMSRHGEESLPRLAKRLGVSIEHRIQVYVAPTQEIFRTLQPGGPPTWADATAYPLIDAVFLRTPDIRKHAATPLEQVFDHELTHILLGRAFHPDRPPSWLQEGTAQVLAGEYGLVQQRRLARRLIAGSNVRLRDLEAGFPAEAHRASIAYTLAADFVAWLQAEYGPDVVEKIVALVRKNASLEEAVEAVTQQPFPGVEARWKERLDQGSALWWSAVISEEVIWSLMGVLALVAVIVARMRMKRRLVEALRRERIKEALLLQMWSDLFARPEGAIELTEPEES